MTTSLSSDWKIDTYSTGKISQVRVTHIPTGIVEAGKVGESRASVWARAILRLAQEDTETALKPSTPKD